MEPRPKSKEVRDFQSKVMGTDVETSIQLDLCVQCKQRATEFTDDRSRREFAISGLCQKCQDRIFNSE